MVAMSGFGPEDVGSNPTPADKTIPPCADFVLSWVEVVRTYPDQTYKLR